jgi:hypothetical protein
MKILTALFGGNVGFGRLKIKKWTIYPISIVVIMLALVGAFEMDIHSPKFAAETLEMAHVASDNGYEIRAMGLYQEACDEGNAEACQVIRDEKDPGVRARDIQDAKKTCEETGDRASCRSLPQLVELDREARLKK